MTTRSHLTFDHYPKRVGGNSRMIFQNPNDFRTVFGGPKLWFLKDVADSHGPSWHKDVLHPEDNSITNKEATLSNVQLSCFRVLWLPIPQHSKLRFWKLLGIDLFFQCLVLTCSMGHVTPETRPVGNALLLTAGIPLQASDPQNRELIGSRGSNQMPNRFIFVWSNYSRRNQTSYKILIPIGSLFCWTLPSNLLGIKYTAETSDLYMYPHGNGWQ